MIVHQEYLIRVTVIAPAYRMCRAGRQTKEYRIIDGDEH